MAPLVVAWCCTGTALVGLALELLNFAEFPLLRPRTSSEPGTVVACIAMRNERRNVRDCLRSLLAQPEIAAVVVCDDHSTDGTTAELEALSGGSARVRFVRSASAPGKAPALAAAAREADSLGPRFLFFTDADVRLEPGAIAALLAYADASQSDAVSAWPRTRAAGRWDGLFERTLTLFLLQVLPMRLARCTPDPRFAAGNGQMFLVDAYAYRRSGGHAACDMLVEDVALARALKRSGARIALASGAAIASAAGYGTLRDNVTGYGRSLRGGAGRAGALTFAMWQFTAFVAPWLFLPAAPLPAALGVGAGALAHALVARRSGGLRGWGASLLAGGVTATAGALWCALGSGRFVWRGRVVSG